MDREDIQTLINADEIFILVRKEASNASQKAGNGNEVDRNVSGGRSNTNKATDDAAAEVGDVESADKDILEQNPDDAIATSRQVRVHDNVDASKREVGCGSTYI